MLSSNTKRQHYVKRLTETKCIRVSYSDTKTSKPRYNNIDRTLEVPIGICDKELIEILLAAPLPDLPLAYAN